MANRVWCPLCQKEHDGAVQVGSTTLVPCPKIPRIGVGVEYMLPVDILGRCKVVKEAKDGE